RIDDQRYVMLARHFRGLRDVEHAFLHAVVGFDEVTTGVKTGDLVNALKQGEYAIYFRGYKANEGIIEADVRSVNAQQLEVVARRIAEVLNKEKQA
ncbi:hypothetical protein ACMWHP_24330, partial [Klebsiella pneumoniae]